LMGVVDLEFDKRTPQKTTQKTNINVLNEWKSVEKLSIIMNLKL
jgi:hypothetical protein